MVRMMVTQVFMMLALITLDLCRSEGTTFFKQIFASSKSENLATDHKVLNNIFSFPVKHFYFRKIKLWKLVIAAQ